MVWGFLNGINGSLFFCIVWYDMVNGIMFHNYDIYSWLVN